MKFIYIIGYFILTCSPAISIAQKEILSFNHSFNFLQVQQYYVYKQDSLKAKAAEFLIKNLKYHFSVDYHWENYKGQKLDIDELSYQDYKSFTKAEDSLLKNLIGVHPITNTYQDENYISPKFLKNNIEQAYKSWK